MRDFDESTITRAVLERIDNTPDPRVKAVMRSLITHLHDFVRDVRPSQDEWMQAIQFLTRTGQMCTSTRQEFILLSDALGVSMLVDAINNGGEGGTESTVLGPFYVENPPQLANGDDVSGGTPGEPLLVEGRVTTRDGAPVAGAAVDIWHCDDDGFYDVQRPELASPNLRARFRTAEDGAFHFWTIKPRFYPIPDDGTVGELLEATGRHPFRPAHVHFMISAPGFKKVVTHVFADGDPYLDSDAVFAVKQALVRTFTEHPAGNAPDGRALDRPWRHLAFDFKLAAA